MNNVSNASINDPFSSYVKGLFLKEKLSVGTKISEWLIKIILAFSIQRIVIGVIKNDYTETPMKINILLFSILAPLYKLVENSPHLKFNLGFILIWLIEPVAAYYSFWLFPQYDILYGMGNTILLYYGILELAHTYYIGILYIIIHLLFWIFAGYFSGHIPYPNEQDTWFTIFSVFAFHVLFFKHRFESQYENTKIKFQIEKKEALINSLVQAIPEGILVLDYKCRFLLENNSFKALVKDYSNLKYYRQNAPGPGRTNFLIHDLKEYFNASSEKIVFGIVISGDFKLEVTATKIQWELTPAVILTFRNVTDLIKMEKEIVENNSTLQHLRGVSHEFKTPMNVIIHKLKVLINKKINVIEEDLMITLNSAKHLFYCIKTIIDYSSIKFNGLCLKTCKTDILESMKNCVNVCSSYYTIDPNWVKIVKTPETPSVNLIDKSRFKQIFTSLLSQVIK